MNKLIALSRNEWTKTIHKKVVYVILAMLILGIVGLSLSYKIFEANDRDQSTFAENKEAIADQLETTKKQLASVEQKIKGSVSQDSFEAYNELVNNVSKYNYLRSDVEQSELALEYEVNLFSDGFLRDALTRLNDLTHAKQFLELDQTSETKAALDSDAGLDDQYIRSVAQYGPYAGLTADELDVQIAETQKILKEKDYGAYIEGEKARIESDPNLSQERKEMALRDLDLDLKINPQGDNNSSGLYQIINWQTTRDGLLQDIENQYNNMFEPMTDAELAESRQAVDQINHYLEQVYESGKLPDRSSFEFTVFLISVAAEGLIFLIIILAGASISQEIATGSIKGLIIAPVKRSKIFYAKLLNILLIAIAFLLTIWLVLTLDVYSFLNGANNSIYTNTGMALYIFAYLFSKLPLVVMVGLIAFALSNVTRSTSITIGVTMIIQYGLMSVYNFTKMVNNNFHAFFAFMPLEYLDLSPYLISGINDGFTNNYVNSPVSIFGASAPSGFVYETPGWLPFVYWIFLAVCLVWTARDSFVKRDL